MWDTEILSAPEIASVYLGELHIVMMTVQPYVIWIHICGFVLDGGIHGKESWTVL